MKESVTAYLNLVFKIGLVLTVLSTLFLFTNSTTNFYDTPKFLVLFIFVAVILILWTLKFTLQGKVVFTSTPLDIPLILLLVVGVVSTVLSPAPSVSLLGLSTNIHGSLVALLVYVLFYFLLTNNLKSEKVIKNIFFLTSIFGAVLSTLTLLAYFGVKILPAPWTQGVSFTPTGLSFSTTAILAILVPLLVTLILNSQKLPLLLLNSALLILFGVTIALTGSWASWIGGLVGLLFAFLLSPTGKNVVLGKIPSSNVAEVIGLGVPILAVVLILALSFIPPVAGAKNPLYEGAKNFPREIQLDFITSWKISVSAFRDSPFWGTGPATFLFNFTNYKPVEFNNSKFWNLRFDTPFNEYLKVLAEGGGVGLLAFIGATALFVSQAFRVLISSRNQLSTSLALSGLVFFVILLLHSSTLPVLVFGFLILASFWIANQEAYPPRPIYPSGFDIKQLLKVATTSTTSEETIRIEALPSILLTISLALALFASFFGGKYLLADWHHRNALNAVAQNNGVLAYNDLILAERLNPTADLYRTDLAQLNFALANAIAQAKGPTEASPAGSLTDQDAQNIQVLLQQSINEARTAVTLSPRSAQNWEILGLLYRQISGVAQNALIFALDSYGRAIFQDPLNPLLRLNVGGTYYAINNYDLAIRFFTDSVNLKPDYANGYYNLSVALRDKGDLNGALVTAQKVLDLVEPKDESNPDFRVATDHLEDLKSKTAAQNPPQPPLGTPTARDTEALQQKELPKVVDVGTPPEKIATPPAIKASPSPSPTPRP